MRFIRTEIGWIIAAGMALVLIQVGATLATAVQVEETSARIAHDLAKLETTSLSDEKTRQEVLDLRIQNELRGFLSNGLLINIGPIVTAFVALIGALLGLRNYLASREKDQQQQADAAQKARADRAGAELKDAMDRLVKSETWQRAAGILGLQHFLAPDFGDYHLRATSALAMAARMEDDPEVIGAIRIALEQATKHVKEEVLQQVSWQWIKLANARVPERSLRKLDLRNAQLDDSSLAGCDLSGAQLTNARLRGADLGGCKLVDADLAYADLAGARLAGSDLSGASLFEAKVLSVDLEGADLRSAKLDPDAFPWHLTRNWRRAQLPDALRARLLDRYGREPSGPRVLMLMWEVPPFVAGGTWTACYHLVRNLRRAGADVTVVVPWSESLVMPHPFGAEVPVVALGIVPPEVEAGARGAGSAYGGHAFGTSAYGSPAAWSAYGPAVWSAYGSAHARAAGSAHASAPAWSRSLSSYGGAPAWSPYGGVTSSYGGAQPGSAVLLRLIDECGRRFERFARTAQFDLIHAHDWVTFPAAAKVATARGKPFVAHFHSIEADRRPGAPERAIERLERQAVREAGAVVAPSRVTADRIAAAYDADRERIVVAPNTLSREAIAPAECGLWSTRRVLFIGRLTAQKGPDLFARAALRLRSLVPDVTFEARGSGEQDAELLGAGVWLRGGVEWSERGTAFGDASAVVVPSRAEPFGMVILEAMQRRVPVLYPHAAGAAEVLRSGIKLDPTDAAGVAEALASLLRDRNRWEELAAEQAEEIQAYPDRHYEALIAELYRTLTEAAGVAPQLDGSPRTG